MTCIKIKITKLSLVHSYHHCLHQWVDFSILKSLIVVEKIVESQFSVLLLNVDQNQERHEMLSFSLNLVASTVTSKFKFLRVHYYPRQRIYPDTTSPEVIPPGNEQKEGPRVTRVNIY